MKIKSESIKKFSEKNFHGEGFLGIPANPFKIELRYWAIAFILFIVWEFYVS